MEYDLHLHHKLSISKLDYVSKGLSGLVNMGNKCFLNSVIQCLAHTLKLTDYLISHNYKADINIRSHGSELNRILTNFVVLIYEIWTKNQLLKPKSFTTMFCKYITDTKKLDYLNQQNDSHECFLLLIDLLHRSLKYEIEVNITGDLQTETDKVTKQYSDYWKKMYENDYSFIVEIFGGMSMTTVTCRSLQCNDKTHVFEPFNGLSIPITKATLNDCLNDYLSTVSIDGWICEKCKKDIGCDKKSNFWSLPIYMPIQLKRFHDNGLKNRELVSFPIEDFDMTKGIAPIKGDSNDYLYDLYSVIYHSGSANNGHYLCICKNLDGNWYVFDDGNVYKYPNTPDSLVTPDAYMLFYQRKYISK